MKNTKVSSTIEKSNKYIYAQLIDDSNNKVLTSSSSFALKILETKKVGEDLATKAKALKIKKVVFDRSGYLMIILLK